MLILDVEVVNENQNSRITGLQRYAEGKGQTELRADFCCYRPVQIMPYYVVTLTDPIYQAHEPTFA